VNWKPPGRKGSSWAVAESIATEEGAQTTFPGGKSAKILLSINDPHFLSSSIKELEKTPQQGSIASSLAKTLTLGHDQVWRSVIETDANSNSPKAEQAKARDAGTDYGCKDRTISQ
jgi:hypothetical protein